MPTHLVQPGECLSTIALEHGFRNWRTIYDHPDNEALRSKRPNPNVLFPGDEIFIPPRAPKVVKIATGRAHVFHAPTSTWRLRIKLLENEAALDGVKFLLELNDGTRLEGTTGSDGLVELEEVTSATSGSLTFMGQKVALTIGSLDPISRVTGVQQRLRNLGYYDGPIDALVGPRTSAAIRAFQRVHVSGLEPEQRGVIDAASRQKLIEVHDEDAVTLEPEEDFDMITHEFDTSEVDSAEAPTVDYDVLFEALDSNYFEGEEPECCAKLTALVTAVEGDVVVEDGIWARYAVSEYNFQLSQDPAPVRWKVRIGESDHDVVKYTHANACHDPAAGRLATGKHGESLFTGPNLLLKLEPEMAGKSIVVMPYLESPTSRVRVTTQVTWSEVGEYIHLVRRIEEDHPYMKLREVIGVLRKLGGYDDLKFRVLLGGEQTLDPADRIADEPLRDRLIHMTRHQIQNEVEVGIASERPILDVDVAMGHVVTGAAAGLARVRDLDFPYAIELARQVEAGTNDAEDAAKRAGAKLLGERLDNLYAATIAGDLGQSATLFVEKRNNILLRAAPLVLLLGAMPFAAENVLLTAKQLYEEFKRELESPLIGEGTEATEAEMIGDIDGFNIGHWISERASSPGFGNQYSFSEILHSYYTNALCSEINKDNRMQLFAEHGYAELEDQSVRFAVNYAYAHLRNISKGLEGLGVMKALKAMQGIKGLESLKKVQDGLESLNDLEGLITPMTESAKRGFRAFSLWFDEQHRRERARARARPGSVAPISAPHIKD